MGLDAADRTNLPIGIFVYASRCDNAERHCCCDRSLVVWRDLCRKLIPSLLPYPRIQYRIACHDGCWFLLHGKCFWAFSGNAFVWDKLSNGWRECVFKHRCIHVGPVGICGRAIKIFLTPPLPMSFIYGKKQAIRRFHESLT